MATALEATCFRCKETKPASGFSRAAAKKNGLHSWCNVCKRADAQRWGREYSPRKKRGYDLKSKYGITHDEVDEMVSQQQGKCAACGQEAALHVDHDHATGKVRGLLCMHCNLAEGHLKGDPDRMISLAAYIIQHQEVRSGVRVR